MTPFTLMSDGLWHQLIYVDRKVGQISLACSVRPMKVLRVVGELDRVSVAVRACVPGLDPEDDLAAYCPVCLWRVPT